MGRTKSLPLGPQNVALAVSDAPPVVAETISREPGPPRHLGGSPATFARLAWLKAVETALLVPRTVRPPLQEALASPAP